MNQSSESDWVDKTLWVIATVMTLCVFYTIISMAIMFFEAEEPIRNSDSDLTEVITHAIRLENDMIDLERRIERLEIQDSTKESR